MATPLLQKNGKYRLKEFVGTNEYGKQIYKSFTADSPRECKRMYKDWVKQGGKIEVVKAITVEQAMDEYIATCKVQGYSPSTIACYTSIRKKGFKDIRKVPVDKLTIPMVQREVNKSAEIHSPKTLRNELYFLTAVLKTYRPDLDFKHIILAKKQSRKKKVFSRSWASLILEGAKELDPELAAYCALLLCAGIRPSEAYALKWADISAEPLTAISGGKRIEYGTISISKACVKDETGEYQLKDTKTEAGNRVLQVGWNLIEFLDEMLIRVCDDDKLFTLIPEYASHKFSVLRKRLNLPQELRFYDLRHYFATSMVQAGATEEELSAAMGHATAAFTHSVYVEMFSESKQKVNQTAVGLTAEVFG